MRVPEGLLRTPVSQVRYVGDRNHHQASRQFQYPTTPYIYWPKEMARVKLRMYVGAWCLVCCRVSDAPALGCAILGSVAAGLHPSIQSAVEAMVHVARVVQPDPAAHQQYQRYYRAYKALVRTNPVFCVLAVYCSPLRAHCWLIVGRLIDRPIWMLPLEGMSL
jgi:hypothetical protein